MEPTRPELLLLEKRLRITFLRSLLLSAVPAVVGIVLASVVALHFAFGEPTPLRLVPALLVVSLLALGSLALARLLVKDALRLKRPRESRVYRALAFGGDAIARAYVVTGDVRALEVYFADGEHVQIGARRRDAEVLLALVAEHNPGALDI